jgi:mRNA interferase RelE/StbE
LAFRISFRDAALADLSELPRNLQERIVRAVESRLSTEPSRYGTRLRRSLSGLWKLRVGDYRIVYELSGAVVTIWAIRNRKGVYGEAERRAGKRRGDGG